MEEKELVHYSYDMMKKANFLKNINYELETNRAVMFSRKIDEKILFIPKSDIKEGWKREKLLPQNIYVKYGLKLHWIPRKY